MSYFYKLLSSKTQNSTELLVLPMSIYITLSIYNILRNYLYGRKRLSCIKEMLARRMENAE